MKVAAINENKMLRESLQKLLASWRCQAKAFNSSHKTLLYTREKPWLSDAIIIDGTLENSQLNLEDIEDIRQRSRQNTPMIFITKETNSTFAKGLQGICFTLLQHPVEADALRNILGDR